MAYQSVVFMDLDGTLVLNPFDRAVWPVVMEEFTRKSGKTADEIFGMLFTESATRQAGDSDFVQSMDWDEIAQMIAGKLGFQLEANITQLVKDNAGISLILDEGDAALRDLTADHRALVVATKGLGKYQLPVLDALKLTPLFTAILTPDNHQALKKHKAFFGDWPETTRLQIMVGDMYNDDVRYPSEHGFKTVWKRVDLDERLQKRDPFTRALLYPYTDEQPIQADAIITSLAELPDVVRRMEHAGLGFSDR